VFCVNNFARFQKFDKKNFFDAEFFKNNFVKFVKMDQKKQDFVANIFIDLLQKRSS